jgi:hypothetical protein
MENNVEARVARTEANVESLTQGLVSLSSTVKSLEQTVNTGLSSLGDRLGKVGKADSGWAAVILSLAFGVFGLSGWFFNRDMGRLESVQIRMAEAEVINSGERGQGLAIRERLRSDIESLKEQTRLEFKAWEEHIRRETHDVNAMTNAKIEAMDNRFQSEIATLGARDTARVDKISDRLDDVIGRQVITTAENAKQNEALRWLESQKP